MLAIMWSILYTSLHLHHLQYGHMHVILLCLVMQTSMSIFILQRPTQYDANSFIALLKWYIANNCVITTPYPIELQVDPQHNPTNDERTHIVTCYINYTTNGNLTKEHISHKPIYKLMFKYANACNDSEYAYMYILYVETLLFFICI